MARVGHPGDFLWGKELGGIVSLIRSCDICLVGGSSSCSSGISGVIRLEISWASRVGGGRGGRGGPFLFCGRGSGGTRCLGGCDMTNQSVRDPNRRICILWKNTSISSAAS